MITICPKCKDEIDSLLWSKTETREGTLSIDEKGDEEFDEEYNVFLEQEPSNFECPSCGKVVFENEDEAIEFLKGGKK